MAETKYKIPSEKTIRFLYNGIVAFYPDVAKEAFGLGRGTLPFRERWGGFERLDFLRFALNTTGGETIDEAASIVRGWREGKTPERTVPEKLDEMVASLEEEEEKAQAGGRTKPAFEKQKLAKDTLLESERAKEIVEPAATPLPPKGPAPEPEVQSVGIQITPQAGRVVQKFTSRIVSLPVRTAVAWAAPTVAAEQSPTASAALTLWTRGITGAKLEEKASLLEIKEAKRFDQLIKAVKGLESSYSLQTRIFQRSFPVKDITLLLRPEAGVTQGQIALFFNAPEQGGGLSAVPHRSFLGNLLNSAGQQLFGKLASKAVKGLATKAAGKAAGAAVGAEVGAAVGGPAAPVTSIVGAIAGWIAEKIPDLISWLKTHAKDFGIAAVALLAGGAFFGNPFLLAGGLGLGALSLGAGGLGSLGAGAAGFGQGVLTGITGVVLPAVGIPILISLLVIPVAIAIILFIINSGAYLVPPRSELLTGGIVSPYIDVKKTATPDCLNRTEPGKTCGALPGTVRYEIEIRAKKGTLTNIKIDNVYTVFGKGSGTITAPEIEEPASISPVGAFTFSYSVPFGQNLNDSVVYDTLTVTADAPGQAGAVASAVASVIVGNPPASSCPIVGGSISTGSYNGSREVGHGSNSYWSGPAGTDCGYEIPAFSGCDGPTSSADTDGNNVCRSAGTLCPYYGFAADVRRGGAGDVVQLPSIFGRSVTWRFQRRVTIAGGSWGYGYTFTGSDGRSNYSLYLGHVNKVDPPSSLPSGTVLGTLFPNLTPPHVHIELQINGQWVRPDFLCGGAGP